jgi:hypothetical protein
MAAHQGRVIAVTASSVAVREDGKDDVVTTVVALLDNGRICYTGATDGAEWHFLPPIPDARGSASK